VALSGKQMANEESKPQSVYRKKPVYLIQRGRNVNIRRVMIIVAILSLVGCAGTEKQLKMTEGGIAKSGDTNIEKRVIVFPNGTIFGGASAEQMGTLAEIFVDSHNAAVMQMDDAARRQDKATQAITESHRQIQMSTLRIEESTQKSLEAGQKNQETAQLTLKMIEQVSKKQGSGEMTLFFDRSSARLAKGSPEMARLVGFLDFLARESRGRKILIVSIGSASSIGNATMNKKLAQQRSEYPLPIIEKYLVNIPYEIFKVFGTGDLYSPKDVPPNKHQKYQHTRIIAYYETDQFPKLPEEPAKPF
jgi:outer membrane protein OmpA-like peptidoglycan-associated protein